MEKKHPLLHTPLVILAFQEKDRKKNPNNQFWLQPFLAVKGSSSLVNTNSFSYYSQGLSLSTIGSCMLLPSNSAAMFQTRSTSSLPALGEMVCCVFQ